MGPFKKGGSVSFRDGGHFGEAILTTGEPWKHLHSHMASRPAVVAIKCFGDAWTP